MARGRPRKHSPTVPKHIDQTKIPTGIYWDNRWAGTWYALEVDAAGRSRRANVAGRTATLADLHRIAEERRGEDRGSLAWLMQQFEESDACRKLQPTTKADYAYCRAVVDAYRTRSGQALSSLQVRLLTAPFLQRVIDALAKDHPSKAAHVRRYLRRLFSWGIPRGHCASNPASGVEAPKERKLRRLPDPPAMAALIAFAAARGAGAGRRAGSGPAYLWALMDIAYLCRLRAVEARTLTDWHARENGLFCERRKGSDANIVEWTPRLRTAWDFLVARRNAIAEARGLPSQLRPQDRFVVVTEAGVPLSTSTLNTAFQRLMRAALDAGVLQEDQRFGLHDLKRRGVTDSLGTKEARMEASGHKTRSAFDVYDFAVPIVAAAGSILHVK